VLRRSASFALSSCCSLPRRNWRLHEAAGVVSPEVAMTSRSNEAEATATEPLICNSIVILMHIPISWADKQPKRRKKQPSSVAHGLGYQHLLAPSRRVSAGSGTSRSKLITIPRSTISASIRRRIHIEPCQRSRFFSPSSGLMALKHNGLTSPAIATVCPENGDVHLPTAKQHKECAISRSYLSVRM
jgi:hypothetical protein